LIDRLTRDKVSLTSELESYKKKCNSIDIDTHQMAETLRNKYMEVLKERDVLLMENKRVRHDYDTYVKQNDQVLIETFFLCNCLIYIENSFIKDKFCLRDELNSVRNRLSSVENDLIQSKEQSIKLIEEKNKLETDVITHF
jgi:hypothetical protein